MNLGTGKGLSVMDIVKVGCYVVGLEELLFVLITKNRFWW